MQDKKEFFAVFGSPILHSKSPYLYNHFFKQNNINAFYTRCYANTADETFELFHKLKFKGANITAPLKKDVVQFCDSVEANALQINAVNTIVRHNDKILGFNTDWKGVYHSFQQHGVDLNNKKIAVIGAGSAAASAIFAIKNCFKNSKITIINRSNNINLSTQFNLDVIVIDRNINKILNSYDIIVITIPKPEELLSDVVFSRNQIILFADYKSNEYISQVKNQAKLVISGENWLINQAIPAMKYFTGTDKFSQKILPKNYENTISTNNIYLIGFSAAGKTTTGRLLAQKLNWNFVDLDAEIECYENKNIMKIFSENGEEYFRMLESQMLQKISMLQHNVVALGGGCIGENRNQQIIRQTGITIYIYSDLEVSMSRAINTMRPLLQDKNYEEISILYSSRLPKYIENSDLIISSNALSADTISQKISDEILACL